MKQVFRVAIPKPCHEDWDKMNPNEKGRHCMACEKTVVDFSTWSDENIINYLRSSKGSTCGRLSQTQLQRTYTPRSLFRKYFSSHLIKAVAMLVLFIKLKKADAQFFKGKIKLNLKPRQEIVDTPQIQEINELMGDTVLVDTTVSEEMVLNADGVPVKKAKAPVAEPTPFEFPYYEQPMIMGGAIAMDYRWEFDSVYLNRIYTIFVPPAVCTIASPPIAKEEPETPVDLHLPDISEVVNKPAEPVKRVPLQERPNRDAVIITDDGGRKKKP